MADNYREYDVVLFGANGYTGKYTAEHIHCNLPSDIRWAIAGRTASKLEAVNAFLKEQSSDRSLPAVEICSLDPSELEVLVRRTKVLINAIGPYYLYGKAVIEACAKNGTHYLDCTGETPWVYKMIQQYHELAKSTHAILISQCGFESVPADMIAFAVTSTIRKQLSVGTKNVEACLANFKSQASGGTLTTLFGLLDEFSILELQKAMKPWALSIKSRQDNPRESLANKVLGVRKHPKLGYLTPTITSRTNAAMVERSWSFLDYGPKFTYQEFARVSTRLAGLAVHIGFAIGAILLAFPPIRWFARKVLTQPGDGPTRESTLKDQAEYYAVGVADTTPPRTAVASMKWKGSMYHMTGVTLAEAAITLLRDDSPAKRIGGGFLSPATLGQAYLDRLNDAGMKFEAHVEE